MNTKHYVSLEAARLLKEKGYDEVISTFYNEDGLLLEVVAYYNLVFLAIEELNDDHYPAITKAEAIDWLESKEHRINIIYDWIECKWYFTIINGSPTVKSITELEVSDSVFYKTRLEAEEAAIIKALELL